MASESPDRICKRLADTLERLRFMDWYNAGGEEEDLNRLVRVLRIQDAETCASLACSSDTSSDT